jgi:hypothetical protein
MYLAACLLFIDQRAFLTTIPVHADDFAPGLFVQNLQSTNEPVISGIPSNTLQTSHSIFVHPIVVLISQI